jgi:hypothetical protein
MAIFVLNLFGGWSGLLWIVALVWACIKSQHQIVAAEQPPLQPRRREPQLYGAPSRLPPEVAGPLPDDPLTPLRYRKPR